MFRRSSGIAGFFDEASVTGNGRDTLEFDVLAKAFVGLAAKMSNESADGEFFFGKLLHNIGAFVTQRKVSSFEGQDVVVQCVVGFEDAAHQISPAHVFTMCLHDFADTIFSFCIKIVIGKRGVSR